MKKNICIVLTVLLMSISCAPRKPVVGISEIVSVDKEGCSVFSFERRKVSAMPVFASDGTREYRKAYEKRMLYAGAFSYELRARGAKLQVFSRQSIFLGIGRLMDFSDRDLSGLIKNISSWRDLKQGSVVLMKTPRGNFCLLRLEEMTEEKLKFRWIYQPDGTAVFPKVEPFPGEIPYEKPVLTQKELDQELFSLCAQSLKNGKESFNKDFYKLINQGANVNAKSLSGFTPIEEASLGGSLYIVRLLVDTHASINDSLALINAAVMGHFDVCKFLVDNGADIHFKDRHGLTPLDAALRSRNPNEKVVELLRAHGAGQDSLHLTAKLGDIEALKQMINDGVDLNAHDKSGKTALYIAAEDGKANVCKLLLEAGADRNIPLRGKKTTPLMSAAREGNVESLSVFLSANPTLTDKEKGQAFYSASTIGNIDVCKMILATSTNPLSIVRGSPQLIPMLRYGRDEVIDMYSETQLDIPLWAAARRGRVDLVAQAIDRGEDLDKAPPLNHEHETPLLLAVMHDKDDIVKLLLEKGAKPNVLAEKKVWTPLHEAVKKNDIEILEILIDNTSEINPLFRDRTPLYEAVLRVNADMVKKLLKAGADPNILPERYSGKNGRKRVPLHEQTIDKNLQKLLKKYGSK